MSSQAAEATQNTELASSAFAELMRLLLCKPPPMTYRAGRGNRQLPAGSLYLGVAKAVKQF